MTNKLAERKYFDSFEKICPVPFIQFAFAVNVKLVSDLIKQQLCFKLHDQQQGDCILPEKESSERTGI